LVSAPEAATTNTPVAPEAIPSSTRWLEVMYEESLIVTVADEPELPPG
jgi:hypothetical protein